MHKFPDIDDTIRYENDEDCDVLSQCGKPQSSPLRYAEGIEMDQEEEVSGQGERTSYLEVLHQFALSQAELDNLDEIVWNIAKTAIAELGFEDCVVYLLDDAGKTLVQKSAHGPKNPSATDIANLIEIPVGEGIVGSVAASGKVELVSDTSHDSRYIVDDQSRPSELAVPIVHDGRVIGVLDSEHSQKNFFTAEHVKLFTTIASLASTRIDTALAMERLQRTVIKLEATEARLANQAQDLREANKLAEQASNAKSQFLANMSHEIRTPMTAIVGYGDLLTRSDATEDEKIRWVNQLKANSRHLLGVVGDVLDLSRIESGSLEADISRSPLSELLNAVVELMEPRAESEGIQFNLDVRDRVPEYLTTDNVRVRQILLNLLSNAIKYTEEGSVSLIVRSRESAVDSRIMLELSVVDTGLGITKHDLERLFSPFERLYDRDKLGSVDGTGLGLAIAQGFAALLNSRIDVVSTPGRGSTFSILLDVGASESTAMIESCELFAPSASDSQVERFGNQLLGRQILICEDSPAIAEILKCLLERAGAKVRHCDNGLAGLQYVQKMLDEDQSPDLLIMDMQMPVMDGFEATQGIRECGFCGPIIALTAFSTAEDKDNCIAAGCDHYIGKPISAETFLPELLNWI